MDEIFKNKGIDTTYEREKIDYKPQIDYRKAYIPQPDTVPGVHAITLRQRDLLAADIMSSFEQAKAETDGLITIIENRLANDVVPVDDDDAVILGMSQITFSDYKKAIDDELNGNSTPQSQLIAQIYEDYHGYGIEGRIEAEIYRDIRISQVDGNNTYKFFNDAFQNLMGADIFQSEVAELDKIDAMLDKKALLDKNIRNVLNLDESTPIKYSILFDKFSGSSDEWSTIEEDVLEYERITSRINSYTSNPILQIKELGRRKLETWHEYIKSTKSTILSTTSDFLEGSIKCLILKTVRASNLNMDLDHSKLEEMRTYLRGTHAVLSSIDKLMSINLVDINQETRQSIIALINLVKGPLEKVLNGAIILIANKKSELVNDVYEWLDSVDDTNDCFSFDMLAEFVVDGIESVEKKLTDWIVEIYKIITFQHQLNEDKNSKYNQKQRIRSMHKVIKQTQLIIEEILSKLDQIEFNDIVKMIDLAIEQQGWDSSYDPVSDKVISKRDKLHDFAGGIRS